MCAYIFIYIYAQHHSLQSIVIPSVFSSLSPHLLSFFLAAPNPCATSDGKGPCSHLCLINFNQTFSCACPHLMKLQPDKRTCKGKHRYSPTLTDLFSSRKVNNSCFVCV